jgi:hypothetical protein
MPRQRNLAAWIGFVFGLLGVVGFFVAIGLRIGPTALRDTALPSLILIGAGLGLSAIAIRRAVGRHATHRGRILAPLLGVLNLALAILFVLMLYPFATLPDAPAAPAVGSPAPGFRLADHSGAPVELADVRGKNAVLVFYRGHW